MYRVSTTAVSTCVEGLQIELARWLGGPQAQVDAVAGVEAGDRVVVCHGSDLSDVQDAHVCMCARACMSSCMHGCMCTCEHACLCLHMCKFGGLSCACEIMAIQL